MTLTTWIRSRSREHAQYNYKKEVNDSCDSDRLAHPASIEGARTELLLTPEETAKDGRSPCDIITGNSEREESIRGGLVNQAEKTNDDGSCDDAPDHTYGLEADAFADMSEKAGEWECAIAGESPTLSRSSDNLCLKLV